MNDSEWRAVCFIEDWNHVTYDKTLTREAKLCNSLAHVFDGVRHEGEGSGAQYPDDTIARLANHSMIDAAVVLCMRDDAFRVPSELQSRLHQNLLDIKNLNIEHLRRQDQNGDGAALLASPLLYQLLVAAAFEAGNRSLVREMISGVSPPTDTPILFSGTAIADCTFAGKRGFGHGGLNGQDDNGCDLIADLIIAGWAKPHQEMKTWLIHARPQTAAKSLMEVLVLHSFSFDDLYLQGIIYAENLEMLEFALQQRHSKPIHENEQFNLLVSAASAASSSKERMKYLDLLWKHGVRALNWRIKAVPAGVRGREDVSWDLTPLHVAVYNDDAEVVEWMLKRGAKAFRDQLEKNPYDYAKEHEVKEVLEAFQRHPEYKNEDPSLEYRAGMP